MPSESGALPLAGRQADLPVPRGDAKDAGCSQERELGGDLGSVAGSRTSGVPLAPPPSATPGSALGCRGCGPGPPRGSQPRCVPLCGGTAAVMEVFAF